MERFLEYWAACSQIETLYALTPMQLQAYCHPIAQDDYRIAKLNPDLTQNLKAGVVGVIPQFACKDTACFIPYILLCELDNSGHLKAHSYLNLPIILNTVLEPAPLCPISLGSAQDFVQYMSANPPVWQIEERLPTLLEQLEYAQTLFIEVRNGWINDIQSCGWQLSSQSYAFALNALPSKAVFKDLNLEIFDKSNAVEIIDAQAHAPQSAYAKELIKTAWVNAAVKQEPPPCYVWLQPQTPPRYATIFECMEKPSVPEDLLNPYPQLQSAYEVYWQGKQFIRNWDEIIVRNEEKYADKGGLEARIATLSANQKDAKANVRHLEVLNSIWNRQVELLKQWYSALDFIPGVQKNRLARLHQFFKQNFPNDDVTGFTFEKFNSLVIEKMRRAQTTLRMISDALHQVQNDQHQAEIIRARCLLWANSQGLESNDREEIAAFVEKTLWPNIAQLALQYWQQDFAAKQGYNNFSEKEPADIDLLIIERAQYVSPLLAVPLFARSARAVVMGNYNTIVAPKFAVNIDFELAKHFNLIENDADFEDLQFAGVLGSLGNCWNMVTQGLEADEIMPVADKELRYEFIDIKTPSTNFYGSLINKGSIEALLDWLNRNATDRNDVIIYTCFSAQLQNIKKTLESTFFAKIPVQMLQDVSVRRAKISIFVPVHAAPETGPFVFDQGCEMLDQLQANTLDKVLVIGDMSLFKPQLHSASGNFAKLFNIQTINNKNMITEVDCV